MKSTHSSARRLVSLAVIFAVAATVALGADAPKRVLVVTVTTGFRHTCIPLSEEVIGRLAKESGKFAVDFVRQPVGMPRAPGRPRPGSAGVNDPAHQAALQKFAADTKAHEAEWMPKVEAELRKLSPASLRNYNAVLFASTTGDLPLPDKQGFLDWIGSGGAFIGVHAATDTFHGFPAFIDMIGGEFKTHGPQVEVDCINEDSTHAACAHLPETWTLFDEIYQFQNYDRAKVNGLLRLDRHPNDKTPGHYPIAWYKSFGRGRVFYTALGHREDIWDPEYKDKDGRKNPPTIAGQFQQHLLGGILWALGVPPAPAGARR
ncbi:MAG: ThuA domain-containing protein [Opitutus sp.]